MRTAYINGLRGKIRDRTETFMRKITANNPIAEAVRERLDTAA